MITNKTTKAPKRLSTLELFDRYVRQSFIVRSSRDDARELLTQSNYLKNLEDMIRERLAFGDKE